MLGQKLTQQQRAVEQYSRALAAANDKQKENYNRHQDYTQRMEQAKACQEDLRFEVEAATYAYRIMDSKAKSPAGKLLLTGFLYFWKNIVVCIGRRRNGREAGVF